MTSGQILLLLRFFMFVALYVFLGWTVYSLWRTLRSQSQMMISKKPGKIVLYDRRDPPAHEYAFESVSIIIGRDPASELLLEDATVSARHARLSFRQGYWWAEDLSSRNGTFLNGEVISTPVVLATGDVLQFGQVEMDIEVS
jgi:pSer/pThr/pTyr-binding forkhead associated (FHA) protein